MSDDQVARSPEHAWVRRRLHVYALNLLTEVDVDRLEAHLAECSICTDLLAALREADSHDPEDADHIPAALIARWPHVVASIHGVERIALRAHLSHCAGCRSDLEALGFEAKLPVVDSLEVAADHPAREVFSEGVAEPDASTPPRHARGRAPSRTLLWVLGGWGLAASMAAVLLFVRLSVQTDPGRSVAVVPDSSERPIAILDSNETRRSPETAPRRSAVRPIDNGLIAIGPGDRSHWLSFGFAERGIGAPDDAIASIRIDSLQFTGIETPPDVMDAVSLASEEGGAELKVQLEQRGIVIATVSVSADLVIRRGLRLAISPDQVKVGPASLRYLLRSQGGSRQAMVREIRLRIIGAQN